MATFTEHINAIRTFYDNRAVRSHMADALEKLKALVTKLTNSAGATNLFDYPAGTVTLNGITYELTDSGVYVHGTATANSWLALDWGEVNMVAGQKYVASISNTVTGIHLALGYFLDAGMTTHASIGSTEVSTSFTCPSQYLSSRNMIWVPAGATVDAVVKPMLRLASSENASEPEVYTVEEISDKIHSGTIGGGAGFKVITAAALMTDHDQIYVYMGSETGYSNGYWYYWNGTAWTRGAQFYLGTDGTDGTDGVSPTVSVSQITGGNRITIVDATHTVTVDVMDGANEDAEAREAIGDLSELVTTEKGDLVDAINEIAGATQAFEWTTVIDTVAYGVTWRLKVCESLKIMAFDMFGTWTSVPTTKSAFVDIGSSNNLLAYDAAGWSDSYKTHFQYSKNQKAELYITAAGQLKFGVTGDIATNADITPTKGGGCRAKLILPLPSVFSPIVSS